MEINLTEGCENYNFRYILWLPIFFSWWPFCFSSNIHEFVISCNAGFIPRSPSHGTPPCAGPEGHLTAHINAQQVITICVTIFYNQFTVTVMSLADISRACGMYHLCWLIRTTCVLLPTHRLHGSALYLTGCGHTRLPCLCLYRNIICGDWWWPRLLSCQRTGFIVRMYI